MPFKRGPEIRKCKYCNNPPAKNIRPDGRNKGYFRTCGSEECLKANYKDENVIKKKVHYGEKHPMWISDRSEVKHRPRSEQTWWRKEIFERDNYTCQMCYQKGGRLQADHIKPYSQFPDERWLLTNGRTLCESCHKKTPTYGRKLKQLQHAIFE